MFYKICGKGKAVVLLHGFLEEGSMWNHVSKELAKNYRVIVPDLEGFGRSPFISKKLSMEKYAAAVFELLQKEKVKKCVLLGHSMGGYITLHYAEMYPESLRGFGLINSHCFADTTAKKASRKKQNEFIAKHGSVAYARELYQHMFHPDFKNRALVKKLSTRAGKYSPDALIAANVAMMKRKSKAETLKNAKVPVLMINGKQDDIAPLHFTLEQAAYPAIADVHFYNKGKHMSLFEVKKESLAAIEKFVELCFI